MLRKSSRKDQTGIHVLNVDLVKNISDEEVMRHCEEDLTDDMED